MKIVFKSILRATCQSRVLKWQAVLPKDGRYFHSAFMYISFRMTFFVLL